MKSNRFITFFKRALLAVVVVGSFALTGCDDDGDPVVEEPTTYEGSILDLIQDDEYKQANTGSADNSFDSLAKYLTVHPELTAKLDSENEYTFFAPSNQAFINLLNTPDFPQNIELISPQVIMNVLSYHIVADKNMKADLTPGLVLNSEYTDPMAPNGPQQITVNDNGTLKAAPNSANIDIDITSADMETENGVVHIIESVMIPPSTGAVLVPILGTIAGDVLLGANFTNLAKVIMAADAGFTENPDQLQFKVATWLAMPVANETTPTANLKGITFIAVPNAIPGMPLLTEEAADTLIAMEDRGRAWLLKHIIPSKQYTVAEAPANNPSEITQFASQQQIGAANGSTIHVVVTEPSQNTGPYGVILSTNPANQMSFRPIVLADQDKNNGIYHVFAGSL